MLQEKTLLNDSYTKKLIAANTETVGSWQHHSGSLGPFVRISESEKNYIHILAYFNTDNENDFEIKTTAGTVNASQKSRFKNLDKTIPTYEVDIKVTTATDTTSNIQHLWAFVIEASVEIKDENIVSVRIDFNDKKTMAESNTRKIPQFGEPKRGTKVIIMNVADDTK